MSKILNKKDISIIIILDDIRSLNNIGSIFRTCDSFNVEKLLLRETNILLTYDFYETLN